MEAGLKDILLYAGGNLVVGAERRSWEEVEGVFKDIGFDCIYPPNVPPERVIMDLKHDLGLEV